MNKKDQQALDELNQYLESRTDKTNNQSDKQILGMELRSKNQVWLDKITENAKTRSNNQQWRSTTAERNRDIVKDETWKRNMQMALKNEKQI